jgi:hypothetical protein
MADRTFDWQSRHDPRSLNFPIRTAIGATVERRKRFWRPSNLRLDQGSEGACVGFGWTAELIAEPMAVKLGDLSASNRFARELYWQAQRIDEWPGENYEGTSVLAGAKTTRDGGYISGYRWAFGIDDVIDTLCSSAARGGGPVVIGIPWFDGMYETRPSGLVEVSGHIVGGHCITLTGYHPGIRLWREGWTKRFEVVKWRNSWGKDYGVNGDGYVKVEDLAMLLSGRYGAEACVPMGRANPT